MKNFFILGYNIVTINDFNNSPGIKINTPKKIILFNKILLWEIIFKKVTSQMKPKNNMIMLEIKTIENTVKDLTGASLFSKKYAIQ